MAQIIKAKVEFAGMTGNRLVGPEPELINSSIQFAGQGNVLCCEEGVSLRNSTLSFVGDNSVIYLSAAEQPYMLNVSIYHLSTLAFGRKCYFNGGMNIAIGERKHVIIGDGCLFSFGIWMRTSDPHLIYDSASKRRLNPSRSIFIGDHVWLGQDVLIKGAHLGSGCIIGAKTVVSGKKIPSNTSWAGSPARLIKKGIFWEGSNVNRWLAEDGAKREVWPSDRFIYGSRNVTALTWEEIDRKLDSTPDCGQRVEFVKRILNERDKNRFAL